MAGNQAYESKWNIDIVYNKDNIAHFDRLIFLTKNKIAYTMHHIKC